MPDYNLYDTLTPEEKQEADKLLQSTPSYDSFGSPAPRTYDVRPMSDQTYTIKGFSQGGMPMRFQHSQIDIEKDKQEKMNLQDRAYDREEMSRNQGLTDRQKIGEEKARFSFDRDRMNNASTAAIKNVYQKNKSLADIFTAENFDEFINSILSRR